MQRLALAAALALFVAPDLHAQVSSPIRTSTRTALTRGGSPYTVLIIIADDLSAVELARVSQMGGTPNLDYLAAHGFVFETCVASPICSPSRRQMFFGDWHATVSDVCQDPDGTEPQLSEVSLPETLGTLPSALFGKWHIGANPTGGPWQLAPQAHGFDLWRGGVPYYVAGCGGTDYWTWPRVEDGKSDMPTGLYQPGWSLARTNSYLNTDLGGLVVHASHLPHEPFQRPPDDLLPVGWPVSTTAREHYYAMVAALDVSIGRMLARLTTDDVVIFVGDNGSPDQVIPGPFRGKAKTTTFERGIRVPLIMAGGGIPVGSSSALVSAVDLYSTIGELFGSAPNPAKDSRSLVPILTGAASQVRDYAYAGVRDDLRFPADECARSSRYKLRRVDLDHDGIVDRESFYDLLLDPDENTNRITDPALASEIDAHRSWLLANRP